MILDSNVLIPLIQEPGSPINRWIGERASQTRLRVNPIIFAELAPNFALAEQLEGFLSDLGIAIEALAPAECHRAGHAFAEYRRRGGTRTAILPDFLIGAQADARGWPLVTRDRKGFASYFPDLEIIDPTEH